MYLFSLLHLLNTTLFLKGNFQTPHLVCVGISVCVLSIYIPSDNLNLHTIFNKFELLCFFPVKFLLTFSLYFFTEKTKKDGKVSLISTYSQNILKGLAFLVSYTNHSFHQDAFIGLHSPGSLPF